MCGLTGFWDTRAVQADAAQALAQSMAERIRHRGPDDHGAWVDPQAGVALAHRRLSILELSAAGHQPMTSGGGRYVIVFNGEIYNHLELRAELERSRAAIAWRGHSDTESLLAGFEAWGVVETLKRAIGMFAIALWDRAERTLTLARDRIGEKPLYWGVGREGAALLFGSELKALRAHPQFNPALNHEAVALYLRFGYVPAPRTIYQHVHKLQPGTVATWRSPQQPPQITEYWSAMQAMLDGHAQPLAIDATESVERLDALLRSAVSQQMMADVPLGAFLSGGIDSSTVVALMQAQSTRPIQTFSIGFHEEGYDEAQHAKAVARHLGTDHTELYVTAQQALDVVPQLPQMYDEPIADSSQIPTHLVSRLARRHVTVALSGDAGDELFCGYGRYIRTQEIWNRLRRIPAPVRRATGGLLQAVPISTWAGVGTAIGRIWPTRRRMNRLGEKLHKGAEALSGANSDAIYINTISQWTDPARLAQGTVEPRTLLTGQPSPLQKLPDVPRMMAYDLLTYLPDDILVKVDRAAMAVSLETRVPLLDHRVVEFAWRLPMHLKLRQGVSKWALRQVLYRYVPQSLLERPKMGFGVPIGEWLRGPLRDWAEALLTPQALAAEGLLDPTEIRRAWASHLSLRDNNQYPLWTVLMLQAWRQAQRDAAP